MKDMISCTFRPVFQGKRWKILGFPIAIPLRITLRPAVFRRQLSNKVLKKNILQFGIQCQLEVCNIEGEMSDEEREILLLAQIQPLTIEELRFLILRALTRVSSNSSLEFIFQVVDRLEDPWMSLSPECALLICKGVTRILNLSKGRWQILPFFKLKFDIKEIRDLRVSQLLGKWIRENCLKKLESVLWKRLIFLGRWIARYPTPKMSLNFNKLSLWYKHLAISNQDFT